MHGIMQAGMVAVRGEERGHARDHVGWDGSSEGRGERSCTGSCRLGWKKGWERRKVIHGIMQTGMVIVRGEKRCHARDHAVWDGSREERGERSCRGSGMSDVMQGIMQAGMEAATRDAQDHTERSFRGSCRLRLKQ